MDESDDDIERSDDDVTGDGEITGRGAPDPADRPQARPTARSPRAAPEYHIRTRAAGAGGGSTPRAVLPPEDAGGGRAAGDDGVPPAQDDNADASSARAARARAAGAPPTVGRSPPGAGAGRTRTGDTPPSAGSVGARSPRRADGGEGTSPLNLRLGRGRGLPARRTTPLRAGTPPEREPEATTRRELLERRAAFEEDMAEAYIALRRRTSGLQLGTPAQAPPAQGLQPARRALGRHPAQALPVQDTAPPTQAPPAQGLQPAPAAHGLQPAQEPPVQSAATYPPGTSPEPDSPALNPGPPGSPFSPPSPGGSLSESSAAAADFSRTPYQWGEMAISQGAKTKVKDSMILDKDLHAPPYNLHKSVIDHVRMHKLTPEHEGLKSYHIQHSDMMSVMTSYNPYLAAQLRWSLRIIKAFQAAMPGQPIDYRYLLSWERYAGELSKGGTGGRLNSRHQFYENLEHVKNLLREWTRPEMGGGIPPVVIQRHVANQFTTLVTSLSDTDACGVKIMVEVIRLFDPTANASLFNAIMRFFDIGADECQDALSTWMTVQDRAHQVNCFHGGSDDKSTLVISVPWMKLRFVQLASKFLDGAASKAFLAKIRDGDVEGFKLTTAPSESHDAATDIGLAGTAVSNFQSRQATLDSGSALSARVETPPDASQTGTGQAQAQQAKRKQSAPSHGNRGGANAALPPTPTAQVPKTQGPASVPKTQDSAKQKAPYNFGASRHGAIRRIGSGLRGVTTDWRGNPLPSKEEVDAHDMSCAHCGDKHDVHFCPSPQLIKNGLKFVGAASPGLRKMFRERGAIAARSDAAALVANHPGMSEPGQWTCAFGATTVVDDEVKRTSASNGVEGSAGHSTSTSPAQGPQPALRVPELHPAQALLVQDTAPPSQAPPAQDLQPAPTAQAPKPAQNPANARRRERRLVERQAAVKASSFAERQARRASQAALPAGHSDASQHSPMQVALPDAVAAEPSAPPDAVSPCDSVQPSPGQDRPANSALAAGPPVPNPPAPDANGLMWSSPSEVFGPGDADELRLKEVCGPGDADELRIKKELLGYGQTDTVQRISEVTADWVRPTGSSPLADIRDDAITRACGRLDAYKFKLRKIGDLGGDAPRFLLAFYNRDEHAAIKDFRRDWQANISLPQVQVHNQGKAAHLAMEESAFMAGAASVARCDADTELCIQLALEDRKALDGATAGDARAWVRTPGSGGTSGAWGPSATPPTAPTISTKPSDVQVKLPPKGPATSSEAAPRCLRTPAQALCDLRGGKKPQSPVISEVPTRKRHPSARQAKDSKADALRSKMMNERAAADNVRRERTAAMALEDKLAKDKRDQLLEEALTRISNDVTRRVLDDIGCPLNPSSTL
jgi:hypothetical protein